MTCCETQKMEQLSQIAKNFYKSAQEKGFGDLLVSELIEKDY